MTTVHTDTPAVAEDDDDVALSPEERAWWDARREIAYHALSAGAVQVRLARALGLSYPTLYTWRHHPYWQARTAREGQARSRAHTVALFGLDEVAVTSLRAHLEKSPAVALRYALTRGLLASLPEGRPVADEWLDIAREVGREHAADSGISEQFPGLEESPENGKPLRTSSLPHDDLGGA